MSEPVGPRPGRGGDPVVLRPLTPQDHAFVLALNEADVALLSPLDEVSLRALQARADRCDVVEVDGQRAGFLVTVPPGTDYASENYRWHGERFGADFLYLDRVVLAPAFRGRGLAGAVYDQVEDDARPRDRLVLEVNLDPPNEPSLRFHARRGFVEVGHRGEPGHVVALLAKELT